MADSRQQPEQNAEQPRFVRPWFGEFIWPLTLVRELQLGWDTLKDRGCQLAPRVVRFRDAPSYLGMDRSRFNADVRPYMTEVPIGKQGVGFDRLELDAWFEDYKSRNGRPARKGDNTWDAGEYPASSSGPVSGTSTNASVGGEFAKALEQVTFKKRSESSRE